MCHASAGRAGQPVATTWLYCRRMGVGLVDKVVHSVAMIEKYLI